MSKTEVVVGEDFGYSACTILCEDSIYDGDLAQGNI